MSDPRLRLTAPQPASAPASQRRPIGRHLIESGVITARDLIHALALQQKWDAPLGEILLSEGLATETEVLDAVAQQHGLHRVDLAEQPPDPGLPNLLTPQEWLRLRAVPWMQLGPTLIVATARPDRIAEIAPLLPRFETVLAVVARESDVADAIAARGADRLADRAERRVAPQYSSRTWQSFGRRFGLWLGLVLAAAALAVAATPGFVVQLLCLVALATLIPVAALKLAAFALQISGRLHDRDTAPEPAAAPDGPMPRISVLVPLFHETEIAGALIARLRRLRYPRALLDVILVLEEKDTVTRTALAEVELPHWIRAVEVPDTGPLTTKPRALNYALDFCRGDIIGVWDAEDAPAPDQLHCVAARFAQAAPDVACLQGVLDYYNPRSNWLSRCFTIEYAGWWRVLLPGVARLGLVLPLGGTTLFFRRTILESLGGWDAHNVTEDADLGFRLAREGYRTELIPTVTYEEANCRLLPWIRQRSRWLKGFMVTWLVHMRRPRLLVRQLGWWRVIGFHILMAGTVVQFVLAPALWSLWLLSLGVPHPLSDAAGSGILAVIGALCLIAELGNLAIAAAGVSGRAHRFLLPFVPTMPVYFALGAAAAFKAMWELLMRPYFWDKTRHGLSAPDVTPGRRAFPHPDAGGS